MKSHIWFKITHKMSFMFCGRCGLINLKNSATSKAMNAPCPGKEDKK